jgi:hypothetical protein
MPAACRLATLIAGIFSTLSATCDEIHLLNLTYTVLAELNLAQAMIDPSGRLQDNIAG